VSYWSADALVTRMREVIEDSRGTLRTIAANTYSGDLAPGLGLNEEARRGLHVLVDGAPTECRVASVKRSAASPPVIGNIALYDIEVEVRTVYPTTSNVKISDSYRDAVSGLAAKAADVIGQAFGYPGNLLTTQAGTATGLVSGLLSHLGSTYEWRGQANDAGGVLEARHRFKGVAKSAPAVS
jgi:hypothetical protein